MSRRIADLPEDVRDEVFALRNRGCTCEEIVTEIQLGFDLAVDVQAVAQLCRNRVIDRPGRQLVAPARPKLQRMRRERDGTPATGPEEVRREQRS